LRKLQLIITNKILPREIKIANKFRGIQHIAGRDELVAYFL
jgi:hypothetical protein